MRWEWPGESEEVEVGVARLRKLRWEWPEDSEEVVGVAWGQ